MCRIVLMRRAWWGLFISNRTGLAWPGLAWPGRAGHVANAGFIVAPDWRNRGLGRLLGETMLAYAKQLGYRSVIFNLVFSENVVARRLWDKLGFKELGVIPGAVRKNDGTYQDAMIMFRSLGD